MNPQASENNRLINLFRRYGAVRLLDIFLDGLLVAIRERVYKPRSNEYGLTEALFFPRSIDHYTRYVDVAKAVVNNFPKNATILDVGAGERGGISYFLREKDYTLVLLDAKRFKRKHWVRQVIVGDGTKLPFKDDCFDIIVSVATLEHIPKNVRIQLLRESKRISKMIILHFPCEGKNGEFMGRRCDQAFQKYNEQSFGMTDEKTSEHIATGHPVIEEISFVLPGSQISGRKNCNIWYRYMTLSRMPFIGFFVGLLYLLLWKKEDDKPPYYECMLIYRKENEECVKPKNVDLSVASL